MAAAWDFGAHRFQSRHWAMLREKVKDLAPATPAPFLEASPGGQAVPQKDQRQPIQPQRRVTRSRFMN
jgi:hypothetical protein